jgi:hypothetical protein
VKESGSFLKKGGARPAESKKPLRSGLSLPDWAEAEVFRSFLLLFFKKEGLASAL